MGDVTSGMASTVIQLYLKQVLGSFLDACVTVRHAALKVRSGWGRRESGAAPGGHMTRVRGYSQHIVRDETIVCFTDGEPCS